MIVQEIPIQVGIAIFAIDRMIVLIRPEKTVIGLHHHQGEAELKINVVHEETATVEFRVRLQQKTRIEFEARHQNQRQFDPALQSCHVMKSTTQKKS